jgi:hypothetical protein
MADEFDECTFVVKERAGLKNPNRTISGVSA